jgi:hypothetical protein
VVYTSSPSDFIDASFFPDSILITVKHHADSIDPDPYHACAGKRIHNSIWQGSVSPWLFVKRIRGMSFEVVLKSKSDELSLISTGKSRIVSETEAPSSLVLRKIFWTKGQESPTIRGSGEDDSITVTP